MKYLHMIAFLTSQLHIGSNDPAAAVALLCAGACHVWVWGNTWKALDEGPNKSTM
jgi:hypothetical protein